MARRKCHYCGYEGLGLRPSVAFLGAWVCRNKEACNRRIEAKGIGRIKGRGGG